MALRHSCWWNFGLCTVRWCGECVEIDWQCVRCSFRTHSIVITIQRHVSSSYTWFIGFIWSIEWKIVQNWKYEWATIISYKSSTNCWWMRVYLHKWVVWTSNRSLHRGGFSAFTATLLLNREGEGEDSDVATNYLWWTFELDDSVKETWTMINNTWPNKSCGINVTK